MNHDTHNLTQGDEAWHAHRANSYNASDAGTALGINPYKPRSELIRELATGITKEIDAGTQRRFDDGHRFERLARSIAEQIIGEDLAPTTVSIEVPGLSRRLSASLDGSTFGTGENWEHKTLSESLATAMSRGEIPEQYHPQMEQAMMINGAHHCLFMASKFDNNDQLIEEKHLWYESNPALRAKIISAWKQVEADVESYQHQEVIAAPVAERPAELPALDIQIVGNVVASNLAQWRDVVKGRIAAINTNLSTDQEFSDAKAMVKFLDDGEKRIELVKSQVLAQAVDINAVLSAMDEIKETMRSKRLGLDKTVKAREESIKIEIMQSGKDQLAQHIASLNKRLGKVQMPPIAADFAAAIKGKRNLESMRGAVSDLVAAKKIESNEIADRIDANLKTIAAEAEHQFLFHDLATLSMKAPDDLALIIKTRVADHQREEERRAELAREKIRAEEEARAAAKVKAEQEEAERQRKAAEEAAAKIERDRMRETQATTATEPAAPAAPGASSPRLDETPTAAAPSTGQEPDPNTLRWAIYFCGYGGDTSCPPTFMEDEFLYTKAGAEREADKINANALMHETVAPGQTRIYEARLAPFGYGQENDKKQTHQGVTGSARLRDRLDNLARQMTERELSELCVHAAHILEQRRSAV